MIILGRDFGVVMERLFSADVEEAVEITPTAWEKSGVGRRLMETLGRLGEYWL